MHSLPPSTSRSCLGWKTVTPALYHYIGNPTNIYFDDAIWASDLRRDIMSTLPSLKIYFIMAGPKLLNLLAIRLVANPA